MLLAMERIGLATYLSHLPIRYFMTLFNLTYRHKPYNCSGTNLIDPISKCEQFMAATSTVHSAGQISKERDNQLG